MHHAAQKQRARPFSPAEPCLQVENAGGFRSPPCICASTRISCCPPASDWVGYFRRKDAHAVEVVSSTASRMDAAIGVVWDQP
jgi:hypothetical protein